MKRTVRTLIVDDEKLARSRIRNSLMEFESIEVIGEATDGAQAVEAINGLKPDLVLLDIQMPGMSGFAVLERLEHLPAVVFITAYDEYAVRAFEVNAVDYLLKPYTQERFSAAMQKVLKQIAESAPQTARIGSLLDYHRGKRSYLERITVRNTFEYEVFDIDSIDFFTTEGGLVFLYRDGVKYQIDTQLYRLEENLDPERFFRAHRKAVVNLHKIVKVLPWGRGRYVLEFSHRERIQLSRDKVAPFKEKMGLMS